MLSTILPTFDLLLLFLLPLALANPLPLSHSLSTQPNTPRAAAAGAITQFRYSGSGCTQGSNSVAISPTPSGYTTQVYTFKDFETSGTENCELHFQGSGLAAGWQVSLAELDVVGTTTGKVDSVNWFWQAYWSDDASDTLTLSGSIQNPAGSDLIKANVTDPLWSQCIGTDGNPGLLNVNFRVVVTGDGSFEVNREVLKYQIRSCQ